MNLSRSQLIIIGSAVFLVLLLVGIFTGILPGTRQRQEALPQITLTVWGINDRGLMQDFLENYQAFRKNIQINYEELSPETYEQQWINALASGKGPDVIMFRNTWLPKHFSKLVTLDEKQLNLKSLKELFPTVIEQDFAPSGKIFALPLYIDTLALFYNQDVFDKNGIAVPPKDWLDFQNLIPKLRQLSGGKIVKSAAAIGGSEKTVANASDLLMLLMLQAGAQMTNEEFTKATFSENIGNLFPGAGALEFYSKFSNPEEDLYYTWDENQEYSLDNFAKGDTAMIFNYGSVKEAIKNKNPFLNFKASAMPQLADSEKAVNYSNYWGLAVTNNSKNPGWAWDAILYLTVNEAAAENYVKSFNRPPALRSLIQKYLNHPDLGVFAKQALSARSWPQVDSAAVKQIFSDMISAVASGQLDAAAAVSQGERQITELMQTRR